MSVITSGSIVRATFAGGASAGPVSVPGLKKGDILLQLVGPDPSVINMGLFELRVSADDEIQQLNGGNWSGTAFDAVFCR